jgi:hypothetical protein
MKIKKGFKSYLSLAALTLAPGIYFVVYLSIISRFIGKIFMIFIEMNSEFKNHKQINK